MVRNLVGDIGAFIEANEEHDILSASMAKLKEALDALTQTTMGYLAFVQQGKFRQIPLTATRYLEMLAEVTVGWLLLEGATIAHEKMQAEDEGGPDFNFYAGKIHTARFFINNILPAVKARAEIIAGADTSALDIQEDQFPHCGID